MKKSIAIIDNKFEEEPSSFLTQDNSEIFEEHQVDNNTRPLKKVQNPKDIQRSKK